MRNGTLPIKKLHKRSRFFAVGRSGAAVASADRWVWATNAVHMNSPSIPAGRSMLRLNEQFIASGQIHLAAKSILAHYPLTEISLVEKVLSARTDLLFSLGELAYKVGEELEKKRSQLGGSNRTLDPTTQNTTAAKIMHGKLAEFEATYRSRVAALMKVPVADLKDAVYTNATKIQHPPVEPSGISAHMSPVLVIAICDVWLTFFWNHTLLQSYSQWPARLWLG